MALSHPRGAWALLRPGLTVSENFGRTMCGCVTPPTVSVTSPGSDEATLAVAEKQGSVVFEKRWPSLSLSSASFQAR